MRTLPCLALNVLISHSYIWGNHAAVPVKVAAHLSELSMFSFQGQLQATSAPVSTLNAWEIQDPDMNKVAFFFPFVSALERGILYSRPCTGTALHPKVPGRSEEGSRTTTAGVISSKCFCLITHPRLGWKQVEGKKKKPKRHYLIYLFICLFVCIAKSPFAVVHN